MKAKPLKKEKPTLMCSHTHHVLCKYLESKQKKKKKKDLET